MTAPAANLLRAETSPYLLQHAGNPVHWRPWGRAALHEAQEAGKPILLSVGYSACHWCHVMAHESFENADIAALMNALFVNIKVDREERPDVDHLYMSALHALGEQGGWPLTMFLTPDGAPFWGGTYFPPEPRWGRPGFGQVLQGVADAFHGGSGSIAGNVAALQRALGAIASAHPGPPIAPAQIEAAAARLLAATDPVRGGLRGAPKFPNPPVFRFLWQCGGDQGRAAVRTLLTQMSQGGIYDHLGGGYARYSTDAEWLVPHFEKMLYDNAQLLDLLALAHAGAPDPLFAARAAETVQWMTRDMTTPFDTHVQAFAAAEDADSDGEEGRFYVWSADEIDSVLGDEAAAFRLAYDVTPGGNWDGHTILRRVTEAGDAAQEAGLARSRAALLQSRGRRVRPGRDDKVLADWNALAIAALARAGSVFNRPDWTRRAGSACDFVLSRLGTDSGRVAHCWRLGRITAPGLLDDQVGMARACLALYEATGSRARLDEAVGLAEVAVRDFMDSDGSFFSTALDGSDLPPESAPRQRVVGDNATPSGNGLAAELFARLHHLTGEARWRERAEAVLTAWSGLGTQIQAGPTLLAAADLLVHGTLVVVVGDAAAPLLAAALAHPDPRVVVLRGADGLPEGHPAHGKTAPPGQALAYVCRNGACAPPRDRIPDSFAA